MIKAFATLAALGSLAGAAYAENVPMPPANAEAYAFAAACDDLRLPVYFDLGSAELTTTAIAAIDDAIAEIRQCEIEAVAFRVASVEGESPEAARELADARETAVAELLAARGLHAETENAARERLTAPVRTAGLLPPDRAVQVEMKLSGPRAS